MTNRKMTPQRVAAEYDAGVQFNTGINLYDTVQTNGMSWLRGCRFAWYTQAGGWSK